VRGEHPAAFNAELAKELDAGCIAKVLPLPFALPAEQ